MGRSRRVGFVGRTSQISRGLDMALLSSCALWLSSCADLAGIDDYQIAGDPAFPLVTPPACGRIGVPVGSGGCKDVGVPASVRPGAREPFDSFFACLTPEQGDVYVSASYHGEVQDGSRDRPFRSIQAAVDGTGETIVVAAGSYPEAVTIRRRVRLFAECQKGTLSLEQGSTLDASLLLETSLTIEGRSAGGSEIHGLVVRGLRGIQVQDAHDVLLHGIAVRDTKGEGILVDESVRARIDGCSIQNAGGAGLAIAGGAELTIENSIVSDTHAVGFR